jgi:DNA polymerase elongation subunit (family B)
MKRLLLDIETSPSVVYSFDMWGANIDAGKVITPSSMICWAAKWYGQDEVLFRSTFHDGKAAMVTGINELLDAADAVIHYNGKRFDIPHINREFLMAGLGPPAPYKQIDLYQVVKRVFKFTHNKLGYVCEQLGLDTKLDHGEGFDLWVRCLHGDPLAWETMRAYCMQDTRIMEPLYDRLLPWIPNHSSHGAFTGTDVCLNCGSARLQRRGYAVTTTARYRRVQCADCGKWSRETTRDGARTGVTHIAAA